jgi:hypothetical protein
MHQTPVIQKPSDPFEQILWHLEQINQKRSYRWPPEQLEPQVRELASLIESLYHNWLKINNHKNSTQEHSEYLYFVLPYVSFRLLNYPSSKTINIFEASSSQKKQFLALMTDELHELPDSNLVRALLKESLNTLLTFLKSLKHRCEQ